MSAKWYQSKVLKKEAWLWSGKDDGDFEVLKDWAGPTKELVLHRDAEKVNNASVVVSTDEGDVSAGPGDYIVRGIEGELYPVRASVFNQTYEVAQ